MPPWLLFVILIVVILIIVWILISGNPKEETPEPKAEFETKTKVDMVEETEPVIEPAAPDDLKKIEGIGPKIAGLLAEHGLLTFQQLAESSTEKLWEILEAGQIRIADPSTWVEQAKLAASGDWDGLAAMQDELKGGRRE